MGAQTVGVTVVIVVSMYSVCRHSFRPFELQLLAAAAASKPPAAGKEAEASPVTTAEKTNAEADASKQAPKGEGAPPADDAKAAAASSPRSDASCAPSSVGESGVAECDDDTGVSAVKPTPLLPRWSSLRETLRWLGECFAPNRMRRKKDVLTTICRQNYDGALGFMSPRSGEGGLGVFYRFAAGSACTHLS